VIVAHGGGAPVAAVLVPCEICRIRRLKCTEQVVMCACLQVVAGEDAALGGATGFPCFKVIANRRHRSIIAVDFGGESIRDWA
jgi:hypothetical protein